METSYGDIPPSDARQQHASERQLYAQAAMQSAAQNRPSTTIRALLHDLAALVSRRARARRDHRRRAEVDAAGEAAPGERGEARALGKDLEAAIGAGLADAKRAQGVTPPPELADDSADLIAQAQYHYNPVRDVVSRGEFIPEAHFKVLVFGMWAVEFVGLVFLVVGLVLKLKMGADVFFRHPIIQGMNVAVGTACWLGLTSCGAIYAHRLHRARKSGKRWSHRRLRVTIIRSTTLIATWVNVSSYLAANLYVLSGHCHWFSGFVVAMGTIQWTMWNTLFLIILVQAHNANPWLDEDGHAVGRPDSILLDAPWSIHAPKLLLWLLIEGLLIAVGIITGRNLKGIYGAAQAGSALHDCTRAPYDCHTPTEMTAMYAVLLALVYVYFLGTAFYLRLAHSALRTKPYNQMRIAHQMLRLQARLDGVAMAFFALSIVLFIYVGWGSCVSYLQSWLGFLPMFLVITSLVCANTYLVMPKDPGDQDKILQIWLQEFAWAEEDLPLRVAERGSSLSKEAASKLSKEPMWCFETSLKMMYWSHMMYDYEEAPKPRFRLEDAMEMYGLTDFELLWERASDTKALLAWGPDNMVLSFRGTASMANVLADLQAWWTVHPPKRGRALALTRPFVHRGFLRSWVSNDLSERVVERVQQLVQAARGEGRAIQVYVTGHSLGGALATLAAYDIRKACPSLAPLDVRCYTFGAPRTGNHAFAWDYNTTVPDTWGIVNDQDAVVRGGKFWKMYKRPGQRVIINGDGDLIVRPSFIEASVQRQPGGSSVAQHLLTAYHKSFLAVIKAQFSTKGVQGGRQGVLRVVASTGVQQMLDVAGMSASDLRELERDGFQLAKVCRHASFLPRRSRSSKIWSSASSGASEAHGPRGTPGGAASVAGKAAVPVAISLLEVREEAPREAVDEELAAGGNVEVASGSPAGYVATAGAHDLTAAASEAGDELAAAPCQLSRADAASWAVAEAPSAASPLQHYAGRICEGGRCQYTARKHAVQVDSEADSKAPEAPLPQAGACQIPKGAFCLLKCGPMKHGDTALGGSMTQVADGDSAAESQQEQQQQQQQQRQSLRNKFMVMAGGTVKSVVPA